MNPSSPWKLASERPAFPILEASLEVDVAIIGGGIVGIMTAYELTKAGKKVAVLEQGRIAGGASGWTTAFVTQVTDSSLAELRRTFGAEKAARVWQDGAQAIDELERIIRVEKIDCDFMRCPAYVFASDVPGVQKLHQEETFAKQAGFDAQMDDAALGFSTPGYLRVPNQAKFHPVKFLTALAEKTAALGAHIFEQSKVLSYSGTSPCMIKTEHGEVRAAQIVLATHSPFHDPDLATARMTAYQTYVLEAKIPSGLLPEAIFWDTEKPYHYFRVDHFPTYDRIILGGEDHKTGQGADASTHFVSLKTFLKKLLPGVETEIVREWSGEILEPIDGLPFIGTCQKNKHYLMATGFSGNGMTFGVLSGMILRDMVLGKENASAKMYQTLRLSGFWHFMERGYNFTMQFIQGRVRHQGISVDDIKRGEGAIVDIDGKKVAVYKSAQGKILKLSPLCTHLQCTVAWNSAGKTWDCPCHGSRFKKEGDVLNGPASMPLKKIE